MPTFAQTARFRREFKNLTPQQQRAVLAVIRLLVASLREGQFDPRLRIKRVKGYEGIWEVTWAADGRATFEYGPQVRPDEPHIIWRRVGTHDIFREP